MNHDNFEFSGETKKYCGRMLHRLRAKKDFPEHGIIAGELCGWIEKEENIYENACVFGNACVYGNAEVSRYAKVFGDACVFDNACVSEDACVYGNACVCGNSWVCENAKVYGCACASDNAKVFGDAEVSGDARVYGNAKVAGNAIVKSDRDYIVFKNWWSSGRYFTWTRSNNMWRVGCFYGTGNDLIKKAYKDSEESGRNYEAVVGYVNNVVIPQIHIPIIESKQSK